MGWLDSIEHNRWLSAQLQALIAEAKVSTTPSGFSEGPDGAEPSERDQFTLSARMLHAFSLGTLLGLPGSRRYADHATKTLRRVIHDHLQKLPEATATDDPETINSDEYKAEVRSGEIDYQLDNALLISASAAAAVANRPSAHELLLDALHEQERRWLAPNGLVYGAIASGSTQHKAPIISLGTLASTTEAYLAAAEATADPVWIDRAESITRAVVQMGSEASWRVGEYIDIEELSPVVQTEADWSKKWEHWSATPVLEGVQIGSLLRWSRLCIQVRAALRSLGRKSDDALLEAGQDFFERARVDGWRKKGYAGFVTSVGFEHHEAEILDDRHFMWVACEGVCAAVSLARALRDDGASEGEVEHYEHCYRSWLDFINDELIVQPGQWLHALSFDNERIEDSRPRSGDIAWAIQCVLVGRVPMWPPFASAISRGLLDHPEEAPADRRSWVPFRRHR